MPHPAFAPLAELLEPAGPARWSVQIADASSGEVLAAHDAEVVLPTASVGKLFLLLELARELEQGEVDPAEELTWSEQEWVADSGLWYRMDRRRLSVLDLATLIGAVSDNLATNVLVRRLGLSRIQACARDVGCVESTLLDRVRTERRPEHPPTLSVGSAAELSTLLAGLHRRELVSAAVSTRVRRWLAGNTDLSMVASALRLDPLAHEETDRGLTLINKTGTISTARADIGVVMGPRRALAYAVLAAWPADSDPRDQVLEAMRGIGDRLLTEVA